MRTHWIVLVGIAIGGARELGRLDDPLISESSGVAASLRRDGIYFTHNDSGNLPILFAFDRTAHVLARIRVPQSRLVDWEDMAAACGVDGEPYLYVGDIGDNLRWRASVSVYRIKEPELPRDASAKATTVMADPAQEFQLAYPDGPHDAETLLVQPGTLAMYVVTKERRRALLFGATDPRPGPAIIPLVKLGEIATPGADALDGEFGGGAFSPDGRQVVLRTAKQALLYRVEQPFIATFGRVARTIDLPSVKNGESITFRNDGKALLTTSEGESSPVHEIPLD